MNLIRTLGLTPFLLFLCNEDSVHSVDDVVVTIE